jgi:hypothetical protein
MGTLIGFFLDLVKWPVAIFVLVMTPAGAFEFWGLLSEAWDQDIWASPFGMGFSIALVMLMAFGRHHLVRFWSTMEHELTHALFAWLTLVRVIELRTTDGTLESIDESEGHVRLEGDNWLITLGPYFFPTAAAFVLLAMWALASQPTELAHGLLGAATAFSIYSTWQETHQYQEDLSDAGIWFTSIFLPGANLFSYGMLFSYELGGADRTLRYTTSVMRVTWEWLAVVIGG